MGGEGAVHAIEGEGEGVVQRLGEGFDAAERAGESSSGGAERSWGAEVSPLECSSWSKVAGSESERGRTYPDFDDVRRWTMEGGWCEMTHRKIGLKTILHLDKLGSIRYPVFKKRWGTDTARAAGDHLRHKELGRRDGGRRAVGEGCVWEGGWPMFLGADVRTL